jgi:hypothetical protein
VVLDALPHRDRRSDRDQTPRATPFLVDALISGNVVDDHDAVSPAKYSPGEDTREGGDHEDDHEDDHEEAFQEEGQEEDFAALTSPPGLPATRGDCVDAARPCPHTQCFYHLWIDYRVKVGRGVEQEVRYVRRLTLLPETCSLDVADRYDGATLLQVGEALNLTRERVRQIEVAAVIKLMRHRADLGTFVPDKE